MKILIKKIDPTIETKIPRYSKAGDAGLDLVATSKTETPDYIEYGTNLAVELWHGTAGFIMPRSSISKYDLVLCNHVGLVDSGYRGEIKVRFKQVQNGVILNPCYEAKHYNIGDKIAQLVVMQTPYVELEETDELSDTDRGQGGFGSTGL